MHGSAQEVHKTRELLESYRADLLKTVKFMEEEWKGSAGSTFQAISMDFQNASARLHAALGILGTLLNDVGLNLSDGDTQATKQLDNVQVGFAGVGGSPVQAGLRA
jgi:uncharacterized protein YukE